MPSPSPVTTTEVRLDARHRDDAHHLVGLAGGLDVGEHRLQVHHGLAGQVVPGREVGAVGGLHRADDEGVDGELGGGSGREGHRGHAGRLSTEGRPGSQRGNVPTMTELAALTAPRPARRPRRQDGRLRGLVDADRVPRRWCRRRAHRGARAGRHLRRLAPGQGAGLRARAPPTSSTPASPTTCAGSARARRSTRCAAPRPAESSTTSSSTCAPTTTSSSSRTPPTPPRSSRCSRPPRRRASPSRTCTTGTASSRCRARARDEVLRGLGLPVDHDYMSFVETDWEGLPVIVCRTGYTGERGYEIVPPWDVAGSVWDALAAAVAAEGGLPAGLGARDTLRTEMGYPLHGNDLSLDITPVHGRRRPGPSAGTSRSSGAGRPSPPSGRPKQSRLMRGLRGERARHPAVALRGQGRHRRGRRRGHLRHVLADPAPGHRAGAARPVGDPRRRRRRSTCAAATSPRPCRSRRSSRSGCARSERAVDVDLPGPRRLRDAGRGLGRDGVSRRSRTPSRGSARCGTTCPRPGWRR